jgi:uroporphyrinogen-III decarboxylase
MKKMIEAFTAEGLLTVMHFDQDWTLNLPYLRDLSTKMYVCELDSTTDIFKAKEILIGHMCVAGDVPASLQAVSTPADIEAYCKKLIDIFEKDSGSILSSGCTVPADCKFENFKVIIIWRRIIIHTGTSLNSLLWSNQLAYTLSKYGYA